MTDTTPTEPLAATAPLKTNTLGDVITAVGNSIVDDWWIWLLGAFALFVIGTILWVVTRTPARDRFELPTRQREAGDTDGAPGEDAMKKDSDRRDREDVMTKERNTLLRDVQTKIEQGLIDKGLHPTVAELSFDLKEEIRADFNARFPLESPTRTTAERPLDPRPDPSTARRQEFVDDWVNALQTHLTNPTRLAEGQQRSGLTAALAPLTKVQAARKQRNADRKNDQLKQLAAAQQALADQAADGSTQGLQQQEQALTELQFQVTAIDPAAPDAAARLDATQRQLDQIAGAGVPQSQVRNRQVNADMQQPISTPRRSPDEEEEKKVYQQTPTDAPRSGSERELEPD
jgi:hypothetical protein